MTLTGSSQVDLRLQNEDRFFRALVDDGLSRAGNRPDRWHKETGGLTQIQISNAAAVSRPLVSDLVSEQRFGRFLASPENAHLSGRPGRRGGQPVTVEIDPRAGVAIGIEIGHAVGRAAIGDLHGQLLRDPKTSGDEIVGNFDEGPGEILKWATAKARELLDAAGATPDDLVGVGVSLAGPVNGDTGEVRASMGERWATIAPARELQARLGWSCPFSVDNDANCSAIAEHVHAPPPRVADMAYVKWAEGIGAGIILNHRLHRGAGGVAGEIGHTYVGSGIRCARCGTECLETVAALDPMLRKAGLDPEADNAETLIAAIERGDEKAQAAAGEAARALGRALGPVLNTLNPQSLVLGGAIGAQAYTMIADELREGLTIATVQPALRDVRIRKGEMVGRTTVRGAIAATLREHVPDYIRARKA